MNLITDRVHTLKKAPFAGKAVLYWMVRDKRAKDVLPKFINQHSIDSMVVDYSPIKVYKNRLGCVMNRISIPVHQVDAHNIVPLWMVSERKEFAAHTTRTKINSLLENFLTTIPPVLVHPIKSITPPPINWRAIIDDLEIDRSVKSIDWLDPGESAAIKRLKAFKPRQIDYNVKRNDPTKNSLSDLSPYLHYGQLSSQRAAWEISNSGLDLDVLTPFLEQLIVRKELADNFYEFENNHDQFEGFHTWAQKTINNHRNDEREYVYSPGRFEAADHP